MKVEIKPICVDPEYVISIRGTKEDIQKLYSIINRTKCINYPFEADLYNLVKKEVFKAGIL
jgi:hypothetical protein